MNFTQLMKRVFICGGSIFIMFYAFTKACDWISSPSNIGVVAGFSVLLVLLSILIFLSIKGVNCAMKNNKVREFLGLTVIALMLIGIGGCKFIPPGHVGVMVDLYGKNRGVQDTTMVTGRVWYNPWTKSIYEFPTFMQYKVWTVSPQEGSPNDESITFVSKDRIQVNVDVSVAYQFEPAQVPQLFVTFRQPPDVIADTYIRSRIRDAFVRNGSELNAMDILGAGIGTLDADVTKSVNDEMKNIGIHFDYVSVVGHPRIPQQIQNAINAAIESTQQAQQAMNQVAVVKAQADQAVAQATGTANAVKAKADGDAYATLTNAKAEATANQLVAQSVTPELIQYKAISTWNGAVPQYMTNGSSVPFINLNNGK